MTGISQNSFNRRFRRFRTGMILMMLLIILAAALLGVLDLRHFRAGGEDAFDEIIADAARRHAVSPHLVKAVIKQESGFRPWQVGRAGEIGLMQLMPGAVQDWERHTGQACRHRGLLFDPRLNIEIGTWYLGRALKRWHDTEDLEILALAQYNAGPSRAIEWNASETAEKGVDRVRFPSTREYITSVLDYYEKYRQSESEP